MTAFLFDEDHPDLSLIFGPQCASPVINAIIDSDGANYRLLRGSLLHSRYCYDLSEVGLSQNANSETGLSTSSSSMSFQPNLDHYMTIICDLAETLFISGSSMTESELQNVLAQKNIWVVVVPGLENEHRLLVCNFLEKFGPYLGWVKVDWKNPVHYDLFVKSLFQDMFVNERGLHKLSEWPSGTEERKEEALLLAEYKSKLEPTLLDLEAFEAQAPALLTAGETDERGTLSAKRVAGAAATHRQKIGNALSQQSYRAVGNFRDFSTTSPSNGVEFVVPEAKLTQYLLNLDHEKGGPKAQFFQNTLDIVRDDWRYLADQFCQAAPISEFYRLEVTNYGVMHGAQMLITGRNERQVVVETGWKFEESGPGKFLTAYPGDETLINELKQVVGRVPLPSCSIPDRWKKIHDWADANGRSLANSTTPTPMVLEKWGTIWEGRCGFGWVFLPDARKSFAKWALKNSIGYSTNPGVHISSPLATQSIDKNFSYALGYAEVLIANGIDCRADSRLD